MYALVYMLDMPTVQRAMPATEMDPEGWADRQVAEILLAHGGDWWHGRFFVFDGEDALATVYQNIERLRSVPWFVEALESIEVFTISHSSDVGALFGIQTKHRGH